MVGMFENLEAWFNPQSIERILRLSHVSSMHRMFVDSAEEEGIYLKTCKGWINFLLNSLGIFVHDVRDGVKKFSLK